MTTVAEALNELGIAAADGEDLVCVEIAGERVRHFAADEIADIDVATFRSLYLASGAFRSGTVTRSGGRGEANLARVLWLPFDCDLAGWLALPETKAERERELAALWAMPDIELDALLDQHQADVIETFASVGLPIHRLDRSGYGHVAYVNLAPDDQTRVTEARTAHKALVKRLNDVAGYTLVDPAVSDAGTRITRLPGSLNRKGETPRVVRTVMRQAGSSPLETPKPANPPVRRIIPKSGSGLSDADAAAIVAAVRPSWVAGQKHAVALALSGLLAKANVPEEQALAIMDAISEPGDRPQERRRATEDSYARLRSGLQVLGFMRLRDVLPGDALATVDGILGRHKQAPRGRGTTVVAGTPPRGKSVRDVAAEEKSGLNALGFDIDPPPAICYDGWLGEYVKIMDPLCEAPRQYHLAVGLTLAGATIGRKISAQYVSKAIYGNLYTMLVGAAGTSRKDTAIELGIDFTRRAPRGTETYAVPFSVATDVGSAEGLVKYLSENPNTLLYVTEYQRLSRNAKRQSTGTIFPLMINAWNTPVKLENLTKGNPLLARFPFLSVVAAVQPGILAAEMQEEDIQSGFATRWLFVPGIGKEPIPEPPNIDDEIAYRHYGELLRTVTPKNTYDSERRLDLSPQAKERWIAWYSDDRKREALNEDEESMRSRLGVHIRKVALIYAATAGAATIELCHLESAIAYVEWCWTNTRHLLRNWGVSFWNQIENRIEAVLQSRGPLSRRDLQAYCRGRKWSSREFGLVLDAMLKNDQVIVDPANGLLQLEMLNMLNAAEHDVQHENAQKPA